MLGYSVVNSKGQVTIPADIRKRLGIKPGQTMAISKEDDSVTIKQAGDYKSLRGIVKINKPADFKKMKKDFHNYLATRSINK